MFRADLFVALAHGQMAVAVPTCCQSADKTLSMEYFVLKEGFQQIVEDVNDPNFAKCFVGYFIPEFGKSYILADGTEMEFVLPDRWESVENSTRYHRSPGGAPGIDIFGWVDPCCKVHLFDSEDKIYAWKAGPVTVSNPKNTEMQIGHRDGSTDIYLHIVQKTNKDWLKAGEFMGSIEKNHLHFSVKVDGDYVNPLSFMEKKTKTCPVPEPLSATLFTTGGIAVLWALRRQPQKKIDPRIHGLMGSP